MKNLRLEKSRKLAFFIPLVIYFLFIWVFVVERFLLFSIITGNRSALFRYFPRRYNLVLFESISRGFNPSLQHFDPNLILTNLVLFFPLGIYIHALRKKKNILTSIGISFVVILLVESLQYIFATGSFDVDDILLNTIGMVLGVFTFHIVYILSKKDNTLAKASLSAVSLPVVPLLLVLIAQLAFSFPWYITVPLFGAFLLVANLSIYKLLQNEPGHIKNTYLISCFLLFALFFLSLFLVFLPIVPSLAT